MITSDSRYSSAAVESPVSHMYDERGDVELKSNGSPEEISKVTTYLLPTGTTALPRRQYMVKETDNIQLLAYRSLQDAGQWWVIADANPHIRYPLDLKLGDMIYLPE